MGGITNAISKVFGGGGAKAAAAPEPRKGYQAATEMTAQESEGRQNKKAAARGKKRLQIPSQNTATTASTGTGVGTGV